MGPEDANSLRELFVLLLEHLLVWCTYADHLAAARPKDRKFLSSVHSFIVEKIKASNSEKDQSEVRELCWRILFIGWDHLCRTTYQQMEVLKLALMHSSEEVERQSAALASQLQPAEPSLPDAGKAAASIGPAQSFYSTLLHVSVQGLLPMALFHSRFFKYHQSFYDFEILNASVVKSYVVVLETEIYQKAITYYQEGQEEKTGLVHCADRVL